MYSRTTINLIEYKEVITEMQSHVSLCCFVLDRVGKKKEKALGIVSRWHAYSVHPPDHLVVKAIKAEGLCQ